MKIGVRTGILSNLLRSHLAALEVAANGKQPMVLAGPLSRKEIVEALHWCRRTGRAALLEGPSMSGLVSAYNVMSLLGVSCGLSHVVSNRFGRIGSNRYQQNKTNLNRCVDYVMQNIVNVLICWLGVICFESIQLPIPQ